VLGLVIFSLLNIGTVLGAKNTAMNTAHQQARTAMLKMIDDYTERSRCLRFMGISLEHRLRASLFNSGDPRP
jgi:hypothetical protein